MKQAAMALIFIWGVWAAVLSGCASTSPASNAAGSAAGSGGQNLLDQIKANGEIVIGTLGTYPPYNYYDKEGKLTGFEIDIAEEVAKRLGVKAKWEVASWDGLLGGLDSGRFHFIMCQIAVTPEREKKYDFTEPYERPYPVLITLADDTSINSYDDLKGKKVNSSPTSIYGKVALEHGATLIQAEGDALELLKSRRVDVIMNDNLHFLTLQKSRPDVAIRVAARQEEPMTISIPVKKGNPELAVAIDQAVKDMKADGTYLTISEKWFGTDVSGDRK
ncbi:transporter substrate-binding domain-containing protein [Brevibacillus thermoruber]|uniref:transporter substrate-binding domain-containing protein n=1 Tax=Brevibacillus thermoruber TaxID=33942 RepID=UPI004042B944